MDKLLTVRELADRLRVTQTCVYRWLAENRLPVVRFSKRCLRFRESDIQQLLDQLRTGTPDATGALTQKIRRERLKQL